MSEQVTSTEEFCGNTVAFIAPKILFVTTVSTTLRAFLLPYARAFRGMGWRVDALAAGASSDAECLQAFDSVYEINWSRSLRDLRRSLRSLARIRRLVDTNKYDLVHVHTPIAAFLTRMALRNMDNVKVIYTAHGFHFYRGGPMVVGFAFRVAEKVAGRWTDALIVINQEDYEAALRYRIVKPEILHWMPGIGIDTESYQSTGDTSVAADVRDELGIPQHDCLLLSIAELTPRKRPRDLLKALALLNRGDVHLVMAGDGPLSAELSRFAMELSVSNQVHLLGFRHDISRLIEAADVVLLVSQQEGLPRSVMEAMSHGKPVIGTNIRGTRDLLADSGMLVEVGDIEALAAALRTMLEDPMRRIRAGDSGRRRATEEFHISRLLVRHKRLYDQLLMGTQRL